MKTMGLVFKRFMAIVLACSALFFLCIPCFASDSTPTMTECDMSKYSYSWDEDAILYIEFNKEGVEQLRYFDISLSYWDEGTQTWILEKEYKNNKTSTRSVSLTLSPEQLGDYSVCVEAYFSKGAFTTAHIPFQVKGPRIVSVTLDKSSYSVGETIRIKTVFENFDYSRYGYSILVSHVEGSKVVKEKSYSVTTDELTLDPPQQLGLYYVDVSRSISVKYNYSTVMNFYKRINVYDASEPIFTIVYDASGGTGEPSTQFSNYDQAIDLSVVKPTKSHTITYNANGGNVYRPSKSVSCTFENWNTSSNGTGTTYTPGARYKANTDVTLYAQWTNPAAGNLLVPTRTGYTFDGWYTAASGGTRVTSETMITGNITLYAHWSGSTTYTVSYNANGGSGAPSSQSKNYDQTLVLSSAKPTKTYTIAYNANGGNVNSSSKSVNCTFKNWNTSSNGTGTSYSSGANYTANADATLYAQWADPAAGDLPVPTRSGYSFDGWYTESSGGTKVTSATTITGNITLYAHWFNSTRYTVSYNANGGIGAPSSQSKNYDQALVLSSLKPAKNYIITFNANGGSVYSSSRSLDCTFKNWNTSSNGTGTSYSPGANYTANADAALYAQWADPAAGDLPVPTRSGYSFDGWYTESSGGTKVTSATTITHSITLYAHWSNTTRYTVSYNPNGGTGAPSSQTKNHGQTLVLSSAKPANYYTIMYNAMGGDVNPSDKKISCTFKNWNTSSNGSGTSYSPGANYTANADATLYAQWADPVAGDLAVPTRSGYSFDGWYTESSGGTKVTSATTITHSITLYAHWSNPTSYTVSYNANGGIGEPSSQSKNYDQAIVLSSLKPAKYYIITYNPNGGSLDSSGKSVDCTFRNWNTSPNGSGTSYSPGAYYAYNADVTLYAQWADPVAGNLAEPTRSGYLFDGWYTASSGGTRVTSATTITGSVTLYAHWKTFSKYYLNDSDIFSFSNSQSYFGETYYMSDNDKKLLFGKIRALYGDDGQYIINEIQSYMPDWMGSCYGMAAAVVLDKSGQIGFNENFDSSARTMKDVASPSKNSNVKSAIINSAIN